MGPMQASLSEEPGELTSILPASRSQRALCAIASFGGADLLPQEHVLLLCRQQLQELGAGNPGPVTNKATKVGSGPWERQSLSRPLAGHDQRLMGTLLQPCLVGGAPLPWALALRVPWLLPLPGPPPTHTAAV